MIYKILGFIQGVLIPAALVLLVIFLGVVVFKKWLEWHKTGLQLTTQNKAKGVIFGKFKGLLVASKTNDEGHIAAFGGTGSGKTSALLKPTLSKWDGNSLTFDISGDICADVKMPRKLVFAPDDENNTTKFNVFGYIDRLTKDSEKIVELENLALLLLPKDPTATAGAKYYLDTGRKFLTAALIAYYFEGLDFVDICDKITDSNASDFLNGIDATECKPAIKYINSSEGVKEQDLASSLETAADAVRIFATFENLRAKIGRGEKTFEPAKLESHNCFIVIEDERLGVYQPLTLLIVAECLNYLAARPAANKTKILLNIDEFVSFGKLDKFSDALRKLRKKQVRILVLTQSLADLEQTYTDKEAEAMMNNFDYKVLLAANDTKTQTYFADLIGKKETTKTSVTRGGFFAGADSFMEHVERDYEVQPEELGRLGRDLILIHKSGWLRLRKNFFHKQKKEPQRKAEAM